MIRIRNSRSRSKYHAISTVYKGIRYASKAEAARAYQLDILLEARKIVWWLRQVPIDIGEPGVDLPFRVDFLVGAITDPGQESYCNPRLLVHAEDVKGVETASFKRHVKQWRLRGPFPLHVIKGKKLEIIEQEKS